MDTDFARIAALETELAGLRKKDRAGTMTIDVIRQRLTANPHGFMKELGIPIPHVAQCLAAVELGEKAPPELKMYASMSEHTSAAVELRHENQELRQRLSELESKFTGDSTRKSFEALMSAKESKDSYPHLSKAYAANPGDFANDISSHKGSADELAKTLEAQEAKYAKRYAPSAPAGNPSASENKPQDVQSTQDKQPPVQLTSVVPKIPEEGVAEGPWTPDKHARLRDEILHKHGLPKR